MLTYLLNLFMLSRIGYTFNDEQIEFKQIPFYLIIQGLSLAALKINRAWVGLLLSSIVLNVLNIYWERKSRNPKIVRIVSLLLISIIYASIISLSGKINFNPVFISWIKSINDTFSIVNNLDQLSWINTYSLGLLFIINESNTIIRQLFDWIKISPNPSESGDHEVEVIPPSDNHIKVEVFPPSGKHIKVEVFPPVDRKINIDEYKSGRVIGILERIFVYFAVVLSEYSIIGFILAAKAFARFKELEKKAYAEYVLIGTLASILISLIAVSFISSLIN
jgi:hypothetical protein